MASRSHSCWCWSGLQAGREDAEVEDDERTRLVGVSELLHVLEAKAEAAVQAAGQAQAPAEGDPVVKTFLICACQWACHDPPSVLLLWVVTRAAMQMKVVLNESKICLCTSVALLPCMLASQRSPCWPDLAMCWPPCIHLSWRCPAVGFLCMSLSDK